MEVFSKILDHTAWAATEMCKLVFKHKKVRSLMEGKIKYFHFSDRGKHLNCAEHVHFPLVYMPEQFPKLTESVAASHAEHHSKDVSDGGFSQIANAVRFLEETEEGFTCFDLENDVQRIREHIQTTQLARRLNSKSEVEMLLIVWNRKQNPPKVQTVLSGYNLDTTYCMQAIRQPNDELLYFDFVFGSREKGLLLDCVSVEKRTRPKCEKKLRRNSPKTEPIIAVSTELARHQTRLKTIELSEKPRAQKSKKGKFR